MRLVRFLCICFVVALFGSPAMGQDTGQSLAGTDLKGQLTFDFVNWITDNTEAIVNVQLPGVEFRRVASGTYGWRHPDGHLVYNEGCGVRINRLVVDWADGGRDVVSPCSSEIPAAGYGKPRFEFARLSPDKRYVAAEVKVYVDDSWRFGVVVFEKGKRVALYDGYSSPAWMPDGRLILSGDGLYVMDVGDDPERLDDGWLGYGVINADVSPDGEIIVFEWKQQLWIMDTEGKEYKELVTGPASYRFPSWSPDGNYVAFLTTTGRRRSEVDRAIQFIDIRKGEFHRMDLRRFGGNLSHVPYGPISWTE